MPLAVDHSFRLTWRVDDFSLWAGGSDNDVPWPWTPIFAIEALSNTEWQFELNPRTVEDSIACSFTRAEHSEEEEDVAVHYTIHTLGKDSSLISRVTGIVSNQNPGDMRLVKIIQREDLPSEHLPDDRFSFVCEIRQVEKGESVYDLCDGKWKDELQSLSEAVRKLFETGYLSDLKLVADDGRQIAVHSFVLFARWQNLRDSFLGEGALTNRIAVHGVSGPALSAFVSYLYSGTLPGPDVTAELFDFAVENVPRMRKLFRSDPSDVCMRTRQRKEHLTFTWHVGRVDSLPFFRVLRLLEVDGDELVVVLDAEEDEEVGERCLAVTFSLSSAPEVCVVRCTATLVADEVCLKTLSADHRFGREVDEWHFPSFIPMRLLTSGGGKRSPCRRVQFELVVSDEPLHSVPESCVTEFRTGSRGIRNVELLASEFREFFMQRPLSLYDVNMRSEGGSFFSCRAVLSARSRTFHRFFRNRKKGRITLAVREIDSVVFAGVLEYIYTGWTKLTTFPGVLEMLHLANRFSLFGLVRKCERFFLTHPLVIMRNIKGNS